MQLSVSSGIPKCRSHGRVLLAGYTQRYQNDKLKGKMLGVDL